MEIDAGTTQENTSYLVRPGGRVGYDVSGEGPLVVLVPGMGDLRASYRFLAPMLSRSGYRVASSDFRGHGDSDATFSSYGDEATAGDIIALIETLAGPAVVVGNSMAAGSAVLAAAERPELVSGLVLVGPFVRDAPLSKLERLVLDLALAPPFAPFSWRRYLPKLYAGRRPTDFAHYRDLVGATLRRPGHARAFSLTAHTSHRAAENRLGDVRAPSLVVMGDKDPDFTEPEKEAGWIAGVLGAKVAMVPDAGHYPQSQQPEMTAEAILGFLAEVDRRA